MPMATQGEPHARRWAWAAVQVVGMAVLVGLVIRRFEFEAVASSWRGMPAPTALAVVMAVLAAMGLRVWKWQVQVRALGLTAPPGKLARGYLMGTLLGVVTPLRLGELYRIRAATAGESGEAGRAAVAVVVDKGYELLVVLATLTVGLGLLGAPPQIAGPVALATLTLAWLLLGQPAMPWRSRWAGGTDRAQGLGRADRLKLLAATAGAHGLNLVAGLSIWRSFGELTAADYLVRVPLVTLLNTLPVTIGGFGLRELAAIEMFASVGYPAAAAATAAAALFFAANVLPAVVLLPVTIVAERRRR
jgi:uncharacterized membrane protein YbhN (UPF0104 family)